MPVDPRRRQRKLERRKAKQKAERRQLARQESQGLAARFELASAAPILHCCAGASLWRQGIAPVLVSRQLSSGNVAFVDFLVDVYCLGVKNIIMNVVPRARYERELYDKLARQDKLIPLKPECARKLVEGAVEYALGLGLPPYPDYRVAKRIFGDISAEACTEEFTYGKDGKPLFINGPYDSPERCRQIASALQDHCGPDGFHFIMAGPPIGGDEEDYDEEDYEEEYEED
jgi:hypothetical protein